MNPITVLIIDDHALFREGLAALLQMRPNIEIVGKASSALEGIALARERMPDLVLMDVRMDGIDGLEATRRIKLEMPELRVVMLTMSEDEQDLFQALKNGAQGYILKATDPDDFYRSVESAIAGETPISGRMATKLLKEFPHPSPSLDQNESPSEPLSGRELQVLQCLTEGLTNRQIAAKLAITESTVKKHLRNVLSKLHLQNRIQAALTADRERIRTGSRS